MCFAKYHPIVDVELYSRLFRRVTLHTARRQRGLLTLVWRTDVGDASARHCVGEVVVAQIHWQALREQLRGEAVPGLVRGVHVGGQLRCNKQVTGVC
jgi:hypothetical protein